MKIYFILETDVIDSKKIGNYFYDHFVQINWGLPFLPRIGERLFFTAMTNDLQYFKGLDNAKELNEELLELSWLVEDIRYDKDLYFNGKRLVTKSDGDTVIYMNVKGS